MSREAIQRALDRSEPSMLSPGWTLVRDEDIADLREALASVAKEQPAQQPARQYRQLQNNGSKYFGESWDKAGNRTWVEVEVEKVWMDGGKMIAKIKENT